MNTYERLFGSGPVGMVGSIVLFAAAFFLEDSLGSLSLGLSFPLRLSILVVTCLMALGLIAWSVRSLPPGERGRTLVTTGAFRYFRHPLYAAFLTFFNFGLALFLDHGVFLVWAVLLHPLWHLVIRREEASMHKTFPDVYQTYCQSTGRFFPRLFSR